MPIFHKLILFFRVCHGSWICVLILCSSMWVDPARCACQRCLVYRAPDEVIRTVAGVARLHCLYLAGVSVVRCQIVVTIVLLILCVSLPGPEAVLAWSRFSISLKGADWTVSLPGLETLHCRVYCTCTADDICTSTVFWSLHLHCWVYCTCTCR